MRATLAYIKFLKNKGEETKVLDKVSLSEHQQETLDLYLDAYGEAYIWKKASGTRVLNPKEITRVEGSIK